MLNFLTSPDIAFALSIRSGCAEHVGSEERGVDTNPPGSMIPRDLRPPRAAHTGR
jgi:hypothetical protein